MKTGYNVSKEVANPSLKRQRVPGRLRGLWQLAAIVLPFAGAVLVYTWVHEQGLEAGYRIEKLERRLEDLLQEERLLELEATRLARPDRLSQVAIEELGMAPPTLRQMIFLNAESVSLVRASATAATATRAVE